MIGSRLLIDMRHRSLLLQAAATAAFALSSSAVANANLAALAFGANGVQRRSTGSLSQRRDLIPTAPAANGDIDSAPVSLPFPYEQESHNSAKLVVTPDLDRSNFRERLKKTVELCRSDNKTSLWVEVSMSMAGLIEDMVDCGLQFHHAQGKTASLNLWLKDTESKIPEYATHHVGVGAIVVNSREEILCVRELRKNYRPWKIPGGLSELGEHIDEAAVREVFEETGVRCHFHSVVSFRHTHGLALGRSDLYFVCRLEPIETADADGNVIIPDPIAQANEIEKVAWVPLEEYKAMINANDCHPMMQHVMKLYEQEKSIEKTVVTSVVPGRKPSPIYHPPL